MNFDMVKLKPEDKVIAKLTKDDAIVDTIEEVGELFNDLDALIKKCENLVSVLQAKKTLLYADIKKRFERAETSEARGLVLGIRIDDDQLVNIVESKPEDTENSLLEMLKDVLGGDDLDSTM